VYCIVCSKRQNTILRLCLEESSQQESDRRRTGCLVINSVLFAVDPADNFGKCGRQREEVDCDGLYRNRFLTVVHLEKDRIRNGMSTVKSGMLIHSVF